MELLLISEKKMKIMLTREDMESFGLTPEQLDYDIEGARDALDKILESAKAKTGFKGGERTYIQAFPLKSGGCEIFLSVCEKDVAGFITPGGEYLLSCFDDGSLCKKAAEYIQGNNRTNKVKVYKDEYTGRYYLLVPQDEKSEKGKYVKALTYELGARCTITTKKPELMGERYTDVSKCEKE